DQPEAQPEGSMGAGLLALDGNAFARRLEGAIPVAALHAHVPHFDAVALGLPDQRRRLVESHGLGVEEGAGEMRRVVRLLPGRYVHQKGERRRVGLGKTVVAEAFDLLEQGLAELLADTVASESLQQAVPVPQELAVFLPGCHVAPELV